MSTKMPRRNIHLSPEINNRLQMQINVIAAGPNADRELKEVIKMSNTQKIIVKQLWPGTRCGEWRQQGQATTWKGAERIARRIDDPQGFGGFRHPDGGPNYGAIRASVNGEMYVWDRLAGCFVQ